MSMDSLMDAEVAAPEQRFPMLRLRGPWFLIAMLLFLFGLGAICLSAFLALDSGPRYPRIDDASADSTPKPPPKTPALPFFMAGSLLSVAGFLTVRRAKRTQRAVLILSASGIGVVGPRPVQIPWDQIRHARLDRASNRSQPYAHARARGSRSGAAGAAVGMALGQLAIDDWLLQIDTDSAAPLLEVAGPDFPKKHTVAVRDAVRQSLADHLSADRIDDNL